MLHIDMAVWTDTGLCAAAGRLPTLQSRLRHATFQQNESGGICFYINSGWCNNVTVIQQHCSPDLESFCKPFYSPAEFSFILVCVYISLQANVQEAQRTSVERTNLDSLVIVLGDFNEGNLGHELPKYR